MRIEVADRGEKRKTPIGDQEVMDYEMVPHRSGRFFVRYLLKDLNQKIAEDMKKNIASDYDNFMVVVGGEGSGKSNYSYDVLNRFSPGFDIVEAYTYDNDDFSDKVGPEDVGRVFWMDEGSVMANNRNWNTKDNNSLVTTVETCRSRHYTITVDIPTLERLDLYLREYRLRYLITCMPMSFEKYGY